MKKLMFCLLFGVLSCSQVDATFDSVLGMIKSKTASGLLLAKTSVLYAFSCIREPNFVQIKKALESKDAIVKLSQSLSLDAVGEVGLLQNVQALGFDKKNALSALKLIDQHYRAMRSLEQRYMSFFALWNKTLEMDTAVAAISPSLQICKLYKLYFETHQDCLKGWQLVERSIGIDITNAQSALCAVLSWYKNNDTFYILKSVDLLNTDIAYLKACLSSKSYKQSYPQLYSQLGATLSVLECAMEQVKMSAEYSSQLFYKSNKPSIAPKNTAERSEAKEKAEACHDVREKEHNPLIQRMNPFHDFHVDQD